MIVLSEHDVRELLDMPSCIEAMEEVLASLARGELYNPLRSIARPDGADTLLGLMPSHRGGATPSYGLKEIVVVPANPSRGLDTHMGGVLLHDGDTGELLAIMNASPITEIRTAAVSAVATRALARPDAQRVAILGAGAQARGHVHAMRAGPRRSESIWRAGSKRAKSWRARPEQRSPRPSTLRSSAPRSCARRRRPSSRSSRSAGSPAALT